MWPGPYGDRGSRKYLLASLDQCLRADGPRLRRHLLLAPARPGHAAGGDDGRARHARCARARRSTSGISSYSARAHAPRRRAILRELGTPLLIHQPSYSMLNRWIEDGLLDVLEREGVGCIVFSPLAQGLLTDRYLDGDPRGLARGARGAPSRRLLTDGEPRARPRAERDRRGAGPDARAARDRLGAARPARDLRADRREQRRAARGQPGRGPPPGLRAGRAGGDRPPRRRGRHQPLGRVERGVTRSDSRCNVSPCAGGGWGWRARCCWRAAGSGPIPPRT